MTPDEIQYLRQFGITDEMIAALAAAGYDTWEKIGPISQNRAVLFALPGLSRDDAHQLWRSLGKVIDVSLARLPGRARTDAE